MLVKPHFSGFYLQHIYLNYATADQNGQNLYPILTKMAQTLYTLAQHIPIYSLCKGVPTTGVMTINCSQALSQKLKSGHRGGMFPHKIIS